MKNLIFIGTNRVGSASSKIANKLSIPLVAIIINQTNLEPKSTVVNTDPDTNVIWIVPTYHNTFSGYSKLQLDSLDQESLSKMSLCNNFIVSASPSNVGVKDFEKTLTFALTYPLKNIELKLKVIGMPEGSEYEVITESYINNILSDINAKTI